jgi:Trypsin-like peptidase domain
VDFTRCWSTRSLKRVNHRSCELVIVMRHNLRRLLIAACVIGAWAEAAPVLGGAASLTAEAVAPGAVAPAAVDDGVTRTAAWPLLFGGGPRAVYDSLPGDVKPHPAVARIIVPEDGSTAYGSGTLVGVRGEHGLVVTNWHVVRDAVGLVEVVFPDGFRSHARPLKVDQDWDLAALVIWRPAVEPVKIADQPPRPGELLTIHGYGRGKYRIATGHCTTYYSPQPDFPHEMVELDVEARQGDSGGPIFNQRGELAGVLFGAGQGTTMGSFAPRVRCFLAAVAPDIDQPQAPQQIAIADRPPPVVHTPIVGEAVEPGSDYPSSSWSPPASVKVSKQAPKTTQGLTLSNTASPVAAESESLSWSDLADCGWYEPLKTALAAVGALAIALQLVKTVL